MTHLSAIVSISTKYDQTHVLDSVIFTFSRSSELEALPLASGLLISPVKNGVNGTRISCNEGLNSNEGNSVNTTVFIIRSNIHGQISTCIYIANTIIL